MLYSTGNSTQCSGGGGGLVTKSCPTLATPWTVARRAPPSMGFSRQGYWSGLLYTELVCVHSLLFDLVQIQQFHFNTCLKKESKKQRDRTALINQALDLLSQFIGDPE